MIGTATLLHMHFQFSWSNDTKSPPTRTQRWMLSCLYCQGNKGIRCRTVVWCFFLELYLNYSLLFWNFKEKISIFSPFTGTPTNLFQIPVLGKACSHPLSTLVLGPCFHKSSQAAGPGPSATCIFPEFGAKGWIKLSNVDLANEVVDSKNFVGSNNFS